jgi:hypothetical protein
MLPVGKLLWSDVYPDVEFCESRQYPQQPAPDVIDGKHIPDHCGIGSPIRDVQMSRGLPRKSRARNILPVNQHIEKTLPPFVLMHLRAGLSTSPHCLGGGMIVHAEGAGGIA